MKLKLTLVFAILMLAGLACNLGALAPAAPALPGPDEIATLVAATVQAGAGDSASPVATAPPAEAGVLPAALYFISDASGLPQVWRLAPDSVTLTQVTDEAEAVEGFAVSPGVGEIAYIVQNQIFTVLPDGSARALIVDGGSPAETDQYFLYEKINDLAWSPDGLTLAYGRGGLNLYSILEGTSQQVLANESRDVGSGLVVADRLFYPDAWSPDGSRLLVRIGYYEGSTYGVWTSASGAFTQLQSRYNACCFYSWSLDSARLWVASPYIGMVDPGLWRFDAASGAETELLPSQNPDGTLNFASFPLELGSDLLYFFANTPDFPNGDVPLTLVRAPQGDINARTILRPETWLLRDLLWAADGRLAIGVQMDPGSTNYPYGTLVLILTDGSPVRPLANSAYAPQWGP